MFHHYAWIDYEFKAKILLSKELKLCNLRFLKSEIGIEPYQIFL